MSSSEIDSLQNQQGGKKEKKKKLRQMEATHRLLALVGEIPQLLPAHVELPRVLVRPLLAGCPAAFSYLFLFGGGVGVA